MATNLLESPATASGPNQGGVCPATLLGTGYFSSGLPGVPAHLENGRVGYTLEVACTRSNEWNAWATRRLGVDDPDALDACLEVLLDLFEQVFGPIGRADDLDSQLGNDWPDGILRWRAVLKPALIRDEGHIGSVKRGQD